MASLQTTDLELVTFNFIRTHYEKKFRQNVPMALKYLTIKFSNRIIGCKLLTIRQDLDFFKLLSSKIPSIRRFNFLFRTSDHHYSAEKFHRFCDNKGGTITIIKNNHGNIFGGYTSKSWTNNAWKYVKDEKAFLFLIKSDDESIQNKCPLLLELNKKHVDVAICSRCDCGPIFGRGYDIFIGDDCNKKGKSTWSFRNCYSKQQSYDIPKVNICGGDAKYSHSTKKNYFQVIDYEVFQIV